ncbi:protein NLRC3-like isoform X2 [Clupea harengus]|uniref:Protein NLRC3-like isoform X2 n=1 Tax=Clupea harengus TaxID=7950 RepID=A0A6P8EYE4_CLUHA|nr:protein NLRC3-like isoform X2 [Clupea harengus]
MACPLTPLMSALEDLKSQELKKFRMYLSEGVMEGFARMPRGKLQEDSDATDIADLMTKMYGGEDSLKITLHILRVIKQNDVAARLQGEMERTQINAQGPLSQLDVSPSDKRNEYDDLQKVKTAIQTDLRSKFGNISECVSTQGQAKYLNEIFVDLYITEGGSGDINDQHEVRQIEATRKRDRDTPIRCADLFRCLPEQKRQITSVLTKGIAGIGKTISVQKFILDWAEQKANEDIAIVVPLPFRDLNLKKEHYSLMDLLYIYAPQLKEMKNLESVHNKVLLIMDGLDECRHILDFQNSPWWSDVSKPTSVGVLLTNLIKGNLLPSAMKWITSRPAAASQIPSEYIHRVTEVRGFSDDQKEEYFRKKISNESMANKIITHMKTSTTLYIMCHIPIFCLISALVFDSMFSDAKPGELPQTLTEMYIHFLIIQTCMKNRKYHGNAPNLKDPLSNSDKGMVLKLGELAYKQLNKGHLIFYEEDLQGCGIDVKKASEYSSLCTEIFREEKGLYQERVFCFVHLSIQEFLAAVYVHVSCVQKNVNVLSLHSDRMDKDTVSLSDVHKKAVEIALLSPNGHLDLFLRFLLGLSREDKQTFLPEATTKRSGLRRLMNAFLKPNPSHKIDTDLTLCVNETIQCIRKEIRRVQAPERTINLFHCLSELKDDSLVKGILNEVSSGTLSHTNMEPDKCSALTYAVLMSGNVLEVFDLNKFRTSAAGQERLLCMLKACKHGR